jgi:hypothetical protein
VKQSGILLIVGAAVVVFYLLFKAPQTSGPLASQQSSLLSRLFPSSGSNPSPLTNRGLLPVNTLTPALSQSPVGTISQVGVAAGGFASLATALTKAFSGNPAVTPTPAMLASGQKGPTISSSTGGLLQGPTTSGTPLSQSAGWQPTDSVIGNTSLTAPVDTTLQTGMNLEPTQVSPLVDNGIGTLPLDSPPDIATLLPGYDSTVPVDVGVVSLPDATTPDYTLIG